MARTLTFQVNGAEYPASPVKIDRKKLYGWRETIALDDEGRECSIVNMDETGTLIIPKGGLALGILSPDMEWVERSSLKAVRDDGTDAEIVKSSFDAPIVLKDKVDTEEFFDHSIASVYELSEAPEALVSAVGEDIYTFTYSYRESYAGSTAFLLVSAGVLFMLVGYKTEYEMLSLSEAALIDEADVDGEDEEESDEIDFSMGL
jgi:hypothetical protein